MTKKILISLLLVFGLKPIVSQIPEVLMHTGVVRICEATVKDSEEGLTTGDYAHNENHIMTICVPGAKNLTLKFTSFCTEKDEDILSIFDGKDTNSTVLGRWSGTKGPGTIISSDSCITLHFKSDKSVSCTGWEADLSTDIIPPPTPRFFRVGTVACLDKSFKIRSNVAINCDSFLLGNTSLTGPKSLGIASITPTGCVNGYTKTFTVNFKNAVNLNGRYTFTLTTNWLDFCGESYTRNSLVRFDVLTCPLSVELTLDDTLLCIGSCTKLIATVSGGDSKKYIYTWTPSTIKGAGPHTVCPNVKTTYILKVTDGISIPSADTITINVLSPPVAQNDTMVCNASANFFLKASPPGGTWGGTGIVDPATGEYNPRTFRGVRKAWYQIGRCADTVEVNSRGAWSLPNVFCQGTPAKALWWYYPRGGVFTGLRTTPNGVFDPDTTAGIYKLSYNWNGCIVSKDVEVITKISVPRFDTACENSTNETLTFSPLGIYPSWFPGLTNSYWGRYNPSAMGGPQTKLITWNGGGCKDTTYLTILGINAGPISYFCPSAGLQTLSGFTPTSNYTWTKGKGITNPTGNQYDPSVFINSTNAFDRDTLEISSSKCKAQTYVYVAKTTVSHTDTLNVCFEQNPVVLDYTVTKLFPSTGGGFWTGSGITGKDTFTASIAGYGYHPLVYHINTCTDTFYAFVRPKPVVQSDTSMCINSPTFNCYREETGGSFSGPGIINKTQGLFRPSTAGSGNHTITYTNSFGCQANFKVRVDAKPIVGFTNTPNEYCFKTQAFPLEASKTGGTFSGNGVTGDLFNPNLAGSGVHKLQYEYVEKTCTSYANLDVTVKDTLKIVIDFDSDEICPGEIVWLKSKTTGGNPPDHQVNWSNGQSGPGTFVFPLSTTLYSGTLSDGCSDDAIDTVTIQVNPRPYFNIQTSAPVCFGRKGWAKVEFPNPSLLNFEWNTFPKSFSDSINENAGNTYRLKATYKATGCSSDTNVYIPGFKAISADFTTYIPNSLPCITNIQPELLLFDGSIGGTKGTWDWGDGNTETYLPGDNPKHTYDGSKSNYTIKLVIENNGGCIDSSFGSVCYKDTILIFAPTIFSPNKDNKNESFKMVTFGPTEIELLIYNRWGEMVFKSKDLNFSWDGTYRGKNCPEGVYTYQLNYRTIKQPWKQKVGVVYILY